MNKFKKFIKIVLLFLNIFLGIFNYFSYVNYSSYASSIIPLIPEKINNYPTLYFAYTLNLIWFPLIIFSLGMFKVDASEYDTTTITHTYDMDTGKFTTITDTPETKADKDSFAIRILMSIISFILAPFSHIFLTLMIIKKLKLSKIYTIILIVISILIIIASIIYVSYAKKHAVILY